MVTAERKDFLDRSFEIGIVLKGLNGLLEVVGGLLILLVSRELLLSQRDDHPTDCVRRRVDQMVGDEVVGILRRGLSGSAVAFGSAYLLSHGLVKMVLVVALLKDKVWAYPWMIAFLIAFIGYQLYRIAGTPTIGLVAMTVFDAVIVWLTVREYRKERGMLQTRPADTERAP